MPYRYGGSRSTTIWIDEELLYRVAEAAEELGYRSFSQLVRDLLEEFLAAYEMSRQMGFSDRVARKRFSLKHFFTSIAVRLRHA